MSKATPGPWEAVGNTIRIDRYGDDDHHIEVCTLTPYLAEKEANSQLIAAAPELLEACRAAKKYLEPMLVEPGRTIFWQLVEAIRKAEGR